MHLVRVLRPMSQPMTGLVPDLVSWGSYFLGGLLILSAVSKVRSFGSFEVAVDRYSPAFPVEIVAAAWLTTEFMSGAFLLAPVSVRFIPATFLFAVGAGGMLKRLSQGQKHGCGCSSRDHPIGVGTFTRNVILVAFVLSGSIFVSGLSLATSMLIPPIALLVGYQSVGRKGTKPALPRPAMGLIPSD